MKLKLFWIWIDKINVVELNSCLTRNMSDASNLFFPAVATSAAVAVGCLVLLQTDRVSRRILDPSQLDTKRRREYTYNWKNAVDKTKLQLDYFLAGGPGILNDDPEIIMKNTEYISEEGDLDALSK